VRAPRLAYLLLFASLAAQAADLKVLSGNGARAAMIGLIASFDRASGNRTVVEFAVNPEAKAKIESRKVPFDVAILSPQVLDDLIRAGHIARGTRTVVGRAGIGVGVREGAPRPDISTVSAFKRTLLSARTVAYSGDAASGKYFIGLVQRLGIVEEMRPRMRPMSADYNVESVANGEAEMIVVVASRISGVPGVTFVGRIPEELQTWIGFTGGVGSRARQPEAARAMLRYFASPPAAAILRANGVEPFAE